jgi:sulfate transport system ATP-binding protein
MSIHVQNIRKTFARQAVLENVTLKVETGEFLALLGPSGSGKTTLLRVIAGLELPEDGRVFFADKEVTDKSAYERRAGFVFQNYALFQHSTVFENIAFGLRVRPARLRPKEPEIRERVENLLKLIQLEGFGNRFPSQLSGGQRQRVALARALAVEPQVLLLDEPFGALDAKVRRSMREWLLKFHNQTRLTSIFVTHDQEEAFELADRVAIFHEGRIQQIGTPEEIQHQPANEFVRDFLSLENLPAPQNVRTRVPLSRSAEPIEGQTVKPVIA